MFNSFVQFESSAASLEIKLHPHKIFHFNLLRQKNYKNYFNFLIVGVALQVGVAYLTSIIHYKLVVVQSVSFRVPDSSVVGVA